MAGRRCALVAMMVMTAAGCLALVAGQAAASGGVDAIQSDMQQREPSWRRQLSSGNWQVRSCVASVHHGGRHAVSWRTKPSLPRFQLQVAVCVCTVGFCGLSPCSSIRPPPHHARHDRQQSAAERRPCTKCLDWDTTAGLCTT